MAQPIDSTTPTAASRSPAHTAAQIIGPTEPPYPVIYSAHTHTHPGNSISSPAQTAVPLQPIADTWTFYYPPPASASLLSSSKESGKSQSIIGPVVGGALAGLVLVFLVTLFVVRKRKKSKEARKRRLDFLEGRNPVGLFTTGGVGFHGGDGTGSAIAVGGGNGSNGAVAVAVAAAAAGNRRVPHKASSYPTPQQQQQHIQQESDDLDEQEEYDPYYAHLQRHQRLQQQAAREYYAALQLHQRQIQGYEPEGQSYQHHQSVHFTPAASSSARRSYDSALAPAMTQITAPLSYLEYPYPYPQRPSPPSATKGPRRHSSPWTTSPSHHSHQQYIAGITGRRVSSFEAGDRNASIDSPPTRSSHIITENHVKIPMYI